MLLRCFFYSLSLYLTIPALSIPKHEAQLPLLAKHELSQPQNTDVVLTFKEIGSDVKHHVAISLRTKAFPGALQTAGFAAARAYNMTRNKVTESHQRYRDHSSHRTRPVDITDKVGEDCLQNHAKHQRGGKRSSGFGNGTKGIALVCSKRRSRPTRR
jgi:hypothetical protein